jgi:uncharacterized protein (DUF433 family)
MSPGNEYVNAEGFSEQSQLCYYVYMDLPELITRDPAICGGEAVLRGTRVTLRTVLASLADGDSVEQILRSFPTLSEQQVKSVIAFAASSAQDDLPLPEVPTIA